MRRQWGGYLLALGLLLVGNQVGNLSTVQAQAQVPPGSWQASLFGNTGCGLVSMLVTFTMDSSGRATDAATTSHGSSCGDGTSTGNTFTITSLVLDGPGTATLGCGPGCGWNFNIQRDLPGFLFNLVDVDPANPNNLLQGVMVRRPTGPLQVGDLSGTWQATLFGNTGCGLVSMLVTFTLDSSGRATDAATTSHGSSCGDGTSTGNTFTITSFANNGAGTATLGCGPGCGWNFNIQAEQPAFLFSLVDVDPANPNNLLQGVAVRRPAAPLPVGGLYGPWQATLFGNTGCGLVSMLVTFTLDPSGKATDAATTTHVLSGSPCADGRSTGNTFTITSLADNGAGTATLGCGPGCGWNFSIQLEHGPPPYPGSTLFNLVDVDPANPNNFLQGVAVRAGLLGAR